LKGFQNERYELIIETGSNCIVCQYNKIAEAGKELGFNMSEIFFRQSVATSAIKKVIRGSIKLFTADESSTT